MRSPHSSMESRTLRCKITKCLIPQHHYVSGCVHCSNDRSDRWRGSLQRGNQGIISRNFTTDGLSIKISVISELLEPEYVRIRNVEGSLQRTRRRSSREGSYCLQSHFHRLFRFLHGTERNLTSTNSPRTGSHRFGFFSPSRNNEECHLDGLSYCSRCSNE